MQDNIEIKLKARRWLDKQEFKELLKIADYIGYDEGAIFRINLKKIISNKYSFDEIYGIISEFDLDVNESQLMKLKDLLNEIMSVEVNIVPEINEILLKIPWNLWRELRDELRKLDLKFYSKDDKFIYYTIKPYNLHNAKKLIEGKGFLLIDKQGLLKEKIIPYPIEFYGELRNYQKEAIEKWKENNYQGVIALPTGAGKTVVAIAGIALTKKRTLIVTYTKEQMFQWKDMILKFTNIPQNLVGLYYAEEKRLAPITITTYQSAFRNISLLGRYYDLLIVDECHHLPAEKFKYIATYSIAPYRLGLSATVVREDGKHVELFPLMGGVIYHKSAAELAIQGYLARYRVYTIKVKLTRNEKREYQELYKLYRALVGTKSFQEVLNAAKMGDTKAQQALKIHSRLRMLIANSESKIRKAVEIAKKELSKGNKIIIFTQYIEQAKRISHELGAFLLTGEIDSKERQRILRKFKEISSGILVVTTVGDEGLDIPDANIGIIVSGTGSRRQFIQRLGRLLRPKKNKEVVLYEIVIGGTTDELLARKRKSILDEEPEEFIPN